MNGSQRVSLILPAIDETTALLETVRQAARVLPHRELEYVVVTHPKYTTSECLAAIQELHRQYGARIVHFHQTLPGIGGALREAFMKATGDVTVIMASDLETDPAVLPGMLAKLEEGYDIAAATRWRKGGGFSGYNPLKLVLNFCFQQFFRILYWTHLTDLTYAYRAYRSDILKTIRWEETRFPFLFETLVKPLRLGYRVAEVYAPWRARTEGVSHNSLGQTLAYLRVGLRVWWMERWEIRLPAARETASAGTPETDPAGTAPPAPLEAEPLTGPALVTGGCGFVGRHLVRALLARDVRHIWIIDDLSTGAHPSVWLGESWEQVSADAPLARWKSGDTFITFLHADALSFFHEQALGTSAIAFPQRFGDVFHLASIVGGRMVIDGDPLLVSKDLAIDAAFFLWLSRKPRSVGRVLYASSSAAYPTNLQKMGEAVALAEGDINFASGVMGVPDMTYGWSKLTGERLARLAHERYGIHIACVRPFSGYGEDQDLSYPMPAIALRIAQRADPVEVWGTGEQARDFVHIDDCVDAFFAVLDHVHDGSGVNIGLGEPTTFNTIIRTGVKLEGYAPEIKHLLDKPVGVGVRYADMGYMFETIGWRPKISLEEGLRRMLAGARTRLSGTALPFTLGKPRTAVQDAIVTTTIYVPRLLEGYVADAQAHDRSVLFVVIADKKTPPEAETFCADLAKRTGACIEYFSIVRQEEYLSRFPALKEHLPYNSIQRRNIGMLYAYEKGCGVIATIDDDNFRITDDYIGSHRLGSSYEADIVRSSTGWINVCRSLAERLGRTIYHRGFPLEKRLADETWTAERRAITPVANAGLWLGDPDLDAIERLYHTNEPIEAIRYTSSKSIALEKGQWAPFNSQNTALARRAIPAFFLSPRTGRYDDIWAAYITKHIADHMGETVTFGLPLVRQERNPHNYWRDLDKERYGHALTLRFVETLASISLSGRTYKECFAELARKMPQAFSARSDIAEDERAFLEGLFEGMRVWAETFEMLEPEKKTAAAPLVSDPALSATATSL